MKLFICSSIIMIALLLGGCSGQKSELCTEENIMPEETTAPTEFQTKEDVVPIKENDQSTVMNDNKEDSWLTYAEKYETEHRFSDAYMPAKCWLIGKENIVQLLSVGGIEDVTVIEHTAVERVEHLHIGEFTSISVFDKTNQSISIMVSPEDAEKLLGLIERH